MFILTVTDNYAQLGKSRLKDHDKTFSGTHKRSTLGKLEKYIETLEDIQLDLQIEQSFKDTRRLTHDGTGKKFHIEINVNGAGEIVEFDDRKKAVERFLEIVDEKGDHWNYEQTESLFVEGVFDDAKEQQHQYVQKPEIDDEPTKQAAERVITALDNSGYSRGQVNAIAKWVRYLATQA